MSSCLKEVLDILRSTDAVGSDLLHSAPELVAAALVGPMSI